MKGDRVEIVVDAGSGAVERYEISASKAGRRIEITTGRGVIEVTEVTRSGRPVRSGRFMASRVVALVELPAAEVASVDETTLRRLGRAEGSSKQAAGEAG
jgi:hypothetical protein